MSLRHVLALLLAGLVACSTQQPPVAALDRQTWTPLPTPWPAPLQYRQQLLTVSLPGSTHDGQSLMTVLTAQQQGLRLIGLTPMGVRLFQIDYDHSGVHSAQLPGLANLASSLPPAPQVLADVMLAYWPLASWQATLPRGWTLVEHNGQRLLRNPARELVTEIHYCTTPSGAEPCSLTQHVFGYQLTLRTLASQPVPTGGTQ